MENSSARNIKIGAILTYVTQFLSIAISFIYVPIMLGKLGQSEYGLYALVQSLIAYLQMSEMGIGTTATRFNSKYIAEGDVKGQRSINGMFFLIYFGIAFICVIVGSLLYLFLDKIYSHYTPENLEIIKSLFIIAVLNLVITFAFKIFNAVIIAYEQYIYLKVITLIQTILGPISMLAVLYLGWRSIGMLCVTTAINLIFGLIQMGYCFSKLNVRLTFRQFDLRLLRTIYSFTIFVFLHSLAHQLFSNTDKVIVSVLLDEVAVAIYAVVIQLEMYYYNFSNVVSGLYLPRLTKLVIKEDVSSSDIMDEIVRISRLQLVIAGLIYGGLLSLGAAFIEVWLGAEYAGAYALTMIILLPQFFGASQSAFNALMQAMNLHKIRAVIGVVSAIFKVVLAITLVKVFGLTGCAIAYVIAYTVRLIAYNVYYHKCAGLNMKEYWFKMMKILVPVLTIIAILYIAFQFVAGSGYVYIVIGAAVYSVIYMLFLWFFGFNAYEKNTIKDIVCKIVKR